MSHKTSVVRVAKGDYGVKITRNGSHIATVSQPWPCSQAEAMEAAKDWIAEKEGRTRPQPAPSEPVAGLTKLTRAQAENLLGFRAVPVDEADWTSEDKALAEAILKRRADLSLIDWETVLYEAQRELDEVPEGERSIAQRMRLKSMKALARKAGR